MVKIIKAKKVEMTQVFLDDGKVVPVTVVVAMETLDENLKDKAVEIIGISKGKGFTGVMKKWNFAGGEATRGQSDKPRQAGSIGAQTPGRVFKGKKMAGRHGNKRVTVRGLRIVEIHSSENHILISGPIPGARNANLTIRVL